MSVGVHLVLGQASILGLCEKTWVCTDLKPRVSLGVGAAEADLVLGSPGALSSWASLESVSMGAGLMTRAARAGLMLEADLKPGAMGVYPSTGGNLEPGAPGAGLMLRVVWSQELLRSVKWWGGP